MLEHRYELIGQIGTGGMSTVWKAHDTVLGRTVAIKRLHPSLASDPNANRRFELEARAAARLSHPGIITVYDTGNDDEGAYIVLEFVEGRNLAQILESDGPLQPTRAADIARQTAAAIDYSHSQGVIHRDIKPSNLMIDSEGEVRVADFGIAKTLSGHTHTETGEMRGTISYMAPELLEGHPASPASDIYSVAAMTYEMLTGSPPFGGDNLGAVMSAIQSGQPPPMAGISSESAAAIARALSSHPAGRHRSAAEFATALAVGATLPIATPEPIGGRASVDEPTRVLAAAIGIPGEKGGRVWHPAWAGLAFLAIGALSVIAWQIRAPADEESVVAASSTTTGDSSTTSGPTMPTTTTTETLTSTAAIATTPEEISSEIEVTLAGLRPPAFKRKDVKEIGDELEHAMGEWNDGDEEKTAEELGKAIDAVHQLPDSSEQDQLLDLFARLAESMGIDLEDVDDDAAED